MSTPQLEDGYIRIVNEVWEALTSIRIPGEARQVLDFIIRKTWGWGKKKDKIPLSQFQIATGLSKNKIIRARKKLITMNLITVPQKGYENTLTYSFNKNYLTWKPLPKKETYPKKGMSVPQKGYGNSSKRKAGKDSQTPKDTSSKDTKTYIAVFDFWNAKNIVTHREIKKFIPHIRAKLEYYSLEEILEAISNYAAILKSPKHYFTHKWGLDEFLSRKGGLDKFMTVNDPFTNFLKAEVKKQQESAPEIDPSIANNLKLEADMREAGLR